MKLNIRKGLFETSSSSEDSLSVYQSMGLYILPIEEYNKFTQGKLYIKLDNTRPSFTNDENCITIANEEAIKTFKISRDKAKIEDIRPYLLYNHREHLYLNYGEYTRMLEYYFYDVEYFSYDNNGEKIFGYYGYIEE